MIKVLITGPEGYWFKTTHSAQDLFQNSLCSPSREHLTLFIHPAGNRYLTLFRAVEGEGGEEEEWCHTPVTPSSVQVGSLKANPPWLLARGNPLRSFFYFPMECEQHGLDGH